MRKFIIAFTLIFCLSSSLADLGEDLEKLREIQARDFERESIELAKQQTLELNQQLAEIEADRKALEVKHNTELRDLEKLHSGQRQELQTLQTELERQQKLLQDQRNNVEQEQKRQRTDLKARQAGEKKDQVKEIEERKKTLKGLHEGQVKLLQRQQEDRKHETI